MHGQHKKLEKASGRDRESEAGRSDGVTLDEILIAGQRHGIEFAEMRNWQLGQILDYCIEAENQRIRAEKKQSKNYKRKATQEDINAYFGAPKRKDE